MAFCTKCGSSNPADSFFCRKCGLSLFTPDTDDMKWATKDEPPQQVTESNESQKKEKPRRVLIVLNGLLLLLIEVILVFVVPVFRGLFSDFGAPLPGPTSFIFTFSMALSVFLMLSVLGAVGFLAKKVVSRGFLKLAMIGQFLLVLFIAYSLFLPIFVLGEVAGGVLTHPSTSVYGQWRSENEKGVLTIFEDNSVTLALVGKLDTIFEGSMTPLSSRKYKVTFKEDGGLASLEVTDMGLLVTYADGSTIRFHKTGGHQ